VYGNQGHFYRNRRRELLAQEKKDRTESFSRVIRRLFAERPALTVGELLDVMQEFKGRGAGPRRKRR
jgi:hypothetical protein